jgi:methionine-rich copper-binding protein CopC
VAPLVLLSLVAWAPFTHGEAEPEARHLRLVSSSPTADTTLSEPPSEIRLLFSEPPQMRGTSIRLTRGADDLVDSSETEADETDPRQIYIQPARPLASGAYIVHWRVIAQDGHTQRGSFQFQVAP